MAAACIETPPAHRKLSTRVGRPLVVILAGIWFFAGFLASQGAIGYHHTWRTFPMRPEQFNLRARPVAFVSQDGLRLRAWWITAKPGSKGTVILAHGSQGNRSNVLPKAAVLVAHGFNVLSLDLRAHGDSEGWFMTSGYLEAKDLLGALAYLRATGHHEPIFLLGYSYGAVAALTAAVETSDLTGVVADSAYPSTYEMTRRAYGFLRSDAEAPFEQKVFAGLLALPTIPTAGRLMFRLRTGVYPDPESGDPMAAVRELKNTPVLFVGSEGDTLAPAAGVRQLFQNCASRDKVLAIIPGGRFHDPIVDHPDVYGDAISNFLTPRAK